MKRFLLLFTVYFSLLSVAPDMQGFQLLEFGNVIEHYNDHYDRFEVASFFSFLSDHYGKSVDLNEQDHRKLPFKLMNGVPVLIVFEKQFVPRVCREPGFTEQHKPVFGEPEQHFLNVPQHIWTPPQLKA